MNTLEKLQNTIKNMKSDAMKLAAQILKNQVKGKKCRSEAITMAYKTIKKNIADMACNLISDNVTANVTFVKKSNGVTTERIIVNKMSLHLCKDGTSQYLFQSATNKGDWRSFKLENLIKIKF